MDVSVPEQYSTALSPYEDSKWTTCEEKFHSTPFGGAGSGFRSDEYSAAGPRDESIVWRFQGNWPPSAIVVMIEWISNKY